MIATRKQAEAAIVTLEIEATPDTVELDAVKEGYRATAKRAHPDGGGSIEAFAAVDRAKCILEDWIARRAQRGGVFLAKEDCPNCEGKGFIMSQRAFRSMRVQCPSCKGTGDAGYDHEKEDI